MAAKPGVIILSAILSNGKGKYKTRKLREEKEEESRGDLWRVATRREEVEEKVEGNHGPQRWEAPDTRTRTIYLII